MRQLSTFYAVHFAKVTNMTNKLKLKDVKDKLKDDTLDLSLCELKEVPVREIVSDYLFLHIHVQNWNISIEISPFLYYLENLYILKHFCIVFII